MIEKWEEYRVVNEALDNLVNEVDAIPKVKKALRHIIKAGGKRTRPIIVLLSGRLCGGEWSEVMNVALAVELIHTASLAHDDVIDRGVVRRNVETLHVKYDTSLAILVGDWLISKSVELVSVYNEEVIRDFARVGMMMAEGEIMDIDSIKNGGFGEEDYFKCIAAKTASLFAYSAKNACRIVSDDKKAAEYLFNYGNNLGIAYQLVDDLLEYLEIFEDKKSEFESRTLPMIYEERYGFEEAVARTLQLIREYANISRKSLDYFDDCESKDKLLAMVDFMTADLLKNYVSKNREVLRLLESYQHT
ncbi:polyprenyl synthetase family protein [Archaeoglobus veneficus]|uniref:Farnesyltranstransferase n=1 Tax=Archaeoglobus veneficus (strain DSM 11195 / SNP6) TaxID=693661 RepID=F2KN57_ARCVS|nr:polyprenyl synthetase family protein [Archaeoglobus veneficus]AEA46158.1 Farnesyltranstransferase [Archaeoglobus veneficus SNP6]